MKLTRRNTGATTGVVVALTMILASLGTAVFYLALYFGASEQAISTTDAGALNAGKGAFALTTAATDAIEHQYDDVADSRGNFNLTNINRVWSRALLANLNVQAMQAQGQATGEALQHADQLYSAANAISTRLTNKLSDSANLSSAFEKIAGENLVRLGGADAKVKSAKEAFKTSFVDRGAESNILFEKGQLPEGISLDRLNPVSTKDGTRIAGYNPIDSLGKKFNLVPFKIEERTRLISEHKFAESTLSAKPLAGIESPVPNAFALGGNTANSIIEARSRAFVQTNPLHKFDLGIPHGFVRVKLNSNKVNYIHNGIPRDIGEYGFNPETQMRGPYEAGSGQVTVQAELGNEYLPPNLFKAIYALPGNHSAITRALVQRCREIKKDFSEAELYALLQCPLTPGVTEYVIFPATQGMLIALPAPMAGTVAPWLAANEKPDGRGQVIARELMPLGPNTAQATLTGAGQVIIPGFALTSCRGEETWVPGSGYKGCLGELQIDRQTDVLSFGFMVPLP